MLSENYIPQLLGDPKQLDRDEKAENHSPSPSCPLLSLLGGYELYELNIVSPKNTNEASFDE